MLGIVPRSKNLGLNRFIGLSQFPRYITGRKLRRKLTLPRRRRLERSNIMRQRIAQFERVIVRSESTLHSLHLF